MAGFDPKTGMFSFGYTPDTDFNLNFGNVATQGFGGFTGGSFAPQTSSLDFTNNSYGISQSANNFGFTQAVQPNIDPNNTLGFNMPQAPVPGVTPPPTTPATGMTGADMLNFGAGVLQTGIGAYFANEQLDQGQQALDLSQEKYDEYLADKRKLDSVGASRAANATSNSISFGG